MFIKIFLQYDWTSCHKIYLSPTVFLWYHNLDRKFPKSIPRYVFFYFINTCVIKYSTKYVFKEKSDYYLLQLCKCFGFFSWNIMHSLGFYNSLLMFLTVHKYGINPQMKCSDKNDIISNLGFPRLVNNHQTVLKLADILNRKWQMFNSLCTSRWRSKKSN